MVKLDYESGLDQALTSRCRRNRILRLTLVWSVVVLATLTVLFVAGRMLFAYLVEEPSMELTLTIVNHTDHPLTDAGLSAGWGDGAEETVGPLLPGQTRQIHEKVWENFTPAKVRIFDTSGVLSGDIDNVAQVFPMNQDVKCAMDVCSDHVILNCTNPMGGNVTLDIPLTPYASSASSTPPVILR